MVCYALLVEICDVTPVCWVWPSFPQTVGPCFHQLEPAVSAAWTWTSVKIKAWGPAPQDPQSLRISSLSEEAMFPNLEELVRIIIKSDALRTGPDGIWESVPSKIC